MRIEEANGDLIITDIDSFSLEQIFECGQCFRWNRTSAESYTGVAFGRALRLTETDNGIIFHRTTREDFNKIWFDYFDFATDYGKIKATLSEDKILANAIGYGSGIRILRQDLWECVVSFIISASNNIPRIKKIIAALCQSFGEEISYMGESYYTFPAPERLAGLSLDDISVIKAGFRDKYILAAAEYFANTEFKRELGTDEAKAELKRIAGIGEKVADCVLLFGLGRRESFPVDVWVKRIMEYCYFSEPKSNEVIADFAKKRFGTLGGYAQQYLFFWAREEKIGI